MMILVIARNSGLRLINENPVDANHSAIHPFQPSPPSKLT